MLDLQQLATIAGKENLIQEPNILKQYSQDCSFVNPVRPRMVIKLHTAEQVQQIVKTARATDTPLIPVSSGCPHSRGDTVPAVGGAIIVDLSEMKKIIHVDRKNRVAMFEPGVTFAELIEKVKKNGLRLNMPLLPRQTKSVVGSLLEREPVTMPKYHWDIADPLACTEIILGTGELFRTGAAAGSGSIEEQWAAGGAQKEAAGPSAASWYRLIQGSQGTMGIVTWASARCEIVPALEEPFWIASSQLEKLLEMTHWLIRLRLVNECFMLNNTCLKMILQSAEGGTGAAIGNALPPWILFFNIAGYEYFPEERVAGQIQDMQEIAQRTGLAPLKDLCGIKADKFLRIVQQPSANPYWKLRCKGGFQDIFFLTIFDNLATQMETMYRTVNSAGYPVSDLSIYLQPVVQGANCHCEFTLFYNPDVEEEQERIRRLSGDAVRNLLDQRAFFSRPYGENARLILNRDAATVNALKKVKNIVDPDWIMNPGKLCF